MKKQIQLDDAFDDEKEELTDELYEALGELRPDAEVFRRGVQDRIDAAKSDDSKAPSGKLNSLAAVSPFVRRAAAFFPPVLLPKSMAKLGFGAPAAAKVGTKFMPGALVFPAISVIMVFFTLLIGLRAIFTRPSDQQRQDQEEASSDTIAWWRHYWLPVGLVTAVSIVLMFKFPGDAFTLLITVSTVSFLGVYASLVRAGLATRQEVGKRAGVAMMWLAALSLQLITSSRTLELDVSQGWLVPLLLIIGGTTCAIIGNPQENSHLKGYRARTPTLIFFGALGVAFIFCIKFLGLAEREATTADVRTWIASYEDAERVQDLDQTITNFYAAGEAPFDLEVLGLAARERLDRELKPGTLNSLHAPHFARLGFFEDEHYEHYENDREIKELLSPNRKIVNGEHRLPELLAHLRFDSFTLEERSLIADKAIAALDPKDQYANAEDVLWIIHFLDALELSERVHELTPATHEILESTWCRIVSGKEAAFAPYKESIERDEEGAVSETRLSFVWLDDTSISVYLMKRMGAPDWLRPNDLTALDAYLWNESHHYGMDDISGPYAAAAVSARALLHTLPAWESSRAERELDEYSLKALFRLRAVIAAALLVVFALLLTLRAPKEAQAV